MKLDLDGYPSQADIDALAEKYGLTGWDDDDDEFLDLSKPITSGEKPSDEYDRLYGSLTIEEVEAQLAELRANALNLDDFIRENYKGEEGADKAKELTRDWQSIKYKLERRQREIEKDNKARLGELGADDYGLDDDGNIIITQTMDGVVAWYEAERAKLTEALELHMQDTVNTLRNTHGIDVDHNVRDAMYETLVHEEVIEQWEPLEF